jgi:hypothetical protein
MLLGHDHPSVRSSYPVDDGTNHVERQAQGAWTELMNAAGSDCALGPADGQIWWVRVA